MADKKISELDAQTGAQTADDDVFVIADVSANVTKKITLSELDNALAARDFNFGDGTKLLMGDDNDLEIFHNSSDSVINDAGTGSLKLQTGGSTKLEVTSGGVTVTGSVTGSLTGNADTATQVFVTDPDPDTDANHYILGVASTSSGNKAVVLDGGVYFNPSLNRLYSNSIFISGAPTGNGFVGFEGSTSDSFETFLYATDPTSDRAIYLPDLGGTLTVTGASQNVSFGTLTADGGISVDNITIDGTEIDLSSGDLTLDVAGDIILDAEDNGKVQLHDGGTWYGLLRRDNNDFQLYSIVQDGDMVFRGNDGGANVTALTLDMSEAGAATFNSTVTASTGGSSTPSFTFSGDTNTGMFRTASDIIGFTTGGTESVQIGSFGVAADQIVNKTASGDLTFDVAGGIILDADDGGSVSFKDGGTRFGVFGKSSNNFDIQSTISDGDIVFKGNDGGSVITALTLNMANAGAATFNSNVGIGCSPNSSSSGVNGLSVGDGGSVPLGSLVSDGASNTETRLGHGYYHDGSNFKYETASVGAAIYQQLGSNAGAQHIWFSNAGGSEDATFTPTERMRIDGSGRVGIGGTPNTSWRNDIADQEVLMLGTEATLFSDGGVTTELWNNAYVNNDDVFKNISTRGASRYFQYQGAHKWFTAASASAGSTITSEIQTTPKMTLDVSGNVLVGTTSAFTSGADNSGGSGGVMIARDDERCLFLKRASGSGAVAEFFRGGITSAVGSISVTTTASAYNTSSDYRLKENVVYDFDATTRLKQLKPARFNFIVDPDTTVDGFLAHEAQAVVPEAITGTKDEVDDDGNAVMQGIDQSKLVPLLVKTIQELEARITALEGA